MHFVCRLVLEMEKAADRVIEMLRAWVVVCVCLHASYIFLAGWLKL